MYNQLPTWAKFLINHNMKYLLLFIFYFIMAPFAILASILDAVYEGLKLELGSIKYIGQRIKSATKGTDDN